MPEQPLVPEFMRALEILEHNTLLLNFKNKNYFSIQNVLDRGDPIGDEILQRILAICVRDLKDDMKYAVICIKIISEIVKREKISENPLKLNLIPVAEGVLKVIQKTASFKKAETLQTLAFESFLSFPDDVLIAANSDCNDVLDIINIYCHVQVPVQSRFQPINIAYRLLKILPPEKKNAFVKRGLGLWFSKVIPIIMNFFAETPSLTDITMPPVTLKSLDFLELLADELAHIDYSNNPQWKPVLESIYSPQKYPTLMKTLLSEGSEHWHRLWIVFIKLLKTQITMNRPGVGSPINSMLPVVETAFKMDVTNRCRAFKCWNVLIDNFSSETNEQFVNKRIKLLIIPLRSNNAKVEETAIAKHDTWWHLIKQYERRMDDRILYPFLHFCFGRHVPDKVAVIPGLISSNVKRKCIETFVEMMGHVGCTGCVDVPKLKAKLISTKVLVEHWSDWLFSLKITIKGFAESEIGLSTGPLRCAWASFMRTIAELPENNIRKDLFNDVLSMLKELVQDITSNSGLASIIVEVLINILLKDTSLAPLLLIKDKQDAPLQNLFNIMTNPLLDQFYTSCITSNKSNSFTAFTNFVVEKYLSLIDKFVRQTVDLPANDVTLMIWAALSESLQQAPLTDALIPITSSLIHWPLKNLKSFNNVETPAMIWMTTFNLFIHKLQNQTRICFVAEVNRVLYKNDMEHQPSKYFALCVLIAVTKVKLHYSENSFKDIKSVQSLYDVANKFSNYKEFNQAFPQLVDLLKLLLLNIVKIVNVDLARTVMLLLNKMLTILYNEYKSMESHKAYSLLVFYEILLADLEAVLKIEKYDQLKSLVADELVKCQSMITESYPFLYSCINSIVKLFPNNKDKIAEEVEKPESLKSDLDKDCEPKQAFTTPTTKSAKKNAKKKEPNIVNTVEENGEEFVVIKSNWKFNPRKLTENQKEKFKRKREDIPALYQDLSQSQDEFKLKSWKTDSQDASTTNSRSTSIASNEDVSSILKNLPGTNIVPKIIDNFFSDVSKPDAIDNSSKVEKAVDSNRSNEADLPKASTGAKTPRMALKDRVFRNVRNLIEKSNISKDLSEPKSDVLNQTISAEVCKTPVSKEKDTTAVVNSAPSKISTERPSRVKRKPKKFDDTQLFLSKRRRNSALPGESQEQEINEDSEKAVEKVEAVEGNQVETNKSVDIEMKDQSVKVDSVLENDKPNDKVPESTIEDKTVNEIVDLEISAQPVKSIEQSNENEIIKENPKEICKQTKDTVGDCPVSDSSFDTSTEDKAKPVKKKRNSAEQNKTTSKTPVRKSDSDEQKGSGKKKKSRIESELAIDMVEGHPFLNVQSEKRVTRKCLSVTPTSMRRKTLTEKLNKSKSEPKITTKPDKKVSEVVKEKATKGKAKSAGAITVSETQDTSPDATQDLSLSQDIIESSQDSTMTTISINSIKGSAKKMPVVVIESIPKTVSDTQNLLNGFSQDMDTTTDILMTTNDKDDSEIPQNKTAVQEKVQDLTKDADTQPVALTEEMDTEPIGDKENISSDEVILISDENPIISLNTEEFPGSDTLEMANADTLPTDSTQFEESKTEKDTELVNKESSNGEAVNQESKDKNDKDKEQVENITNDTTDVEKGSHASSPTRDSERRNKEFLNNTLEISPIKTLSPIHQKSPSPETSSDFLIIKLSGPMGSNGEPLENTNSPEIFTEEKISPDKRDQSPPRQEVTSSNNSPSSSLSLKKNRPQVRSGGRAAQMLGLCVPDRLQTIMNNDRETDEPKKSSPVNTPARRNLRILYNTVENDNSDENEESENFLKFKRSLPTADSSPAGPILKRKLAEIADEATVSPANKRKRVSFHDPVSTTVSVQKYIESSGVRSPQSSALKRLEKQIRNHSHMKSPKRLDNLFKLDTVLTKAVESFNDTEVSLTNDTEMSSLEQTPVVEVVKTTDLNNTEPICPDLVDCKDPIDNIATELSSPTMRQLLIKELEGKIGSVGDLAKMTELEINRLCIRAPKVQVARKVLTDYAAKIVKVVEPVNKVLEETPIEIAKSNSVEVQTSNVATNNNETQTYAAEKITSTQTDRVVTVEISAQTNESGFKSTKDVIDSCLTERSDFVEKLSETLGQESKSKLAEGLPFNIYTDLIMKNMSSLDAKNIISSVVERASERGSTKSGNKQLSYLQDYMFEKFDAKDLILFCSQMLHKIHDKGF